MTADWDDVRAFLAVAETGSLSAAARRLRVSHVTVARRLRRFEDGHGGPALARGAAGYAPTPLGASLLPAAEAMREAALDLARAAERGSERHAPVRISTVALFSDVVTEALLPLLRARPGLAIEVVGENRNVSVARGDADLAVRFGRPEGGAGLARRAGSLGYRLYGSPDYLARTEPPARRVVGLSEDLAWTPIGKRCAELAGRIDGSAEVRLRLGTLAAQHACAAGGGGLALLPCHRAEGDPRLARADPAAGLDWSHPLWLVMRPDIDRLPAARAAADAILAYLAEHAARLAGA